MERLQKIFDAQEISYRESRVLYKENLDLIKKKSEEQVNVERAIYKMRADAIKLICDPQLEALIKIIGKMHYYEVPFDLDNQESRCVLMAYYCTLKKCTNIRIINIPNSELGKEFTEAYENKDYDMMKKIAKKFKEFY